jgi:hypothetical protein
MRPSLEQFRNIIGECVLVLYHILLVPVSALRVSAISFLASSASGGDATKQRNVLRIVIHSIASPFWHSATDAHQVLALLLDGMRRQRQGLV